MTPKPTPKQSNNPTTIRLPDAIKTQFQAAAAAEGLSLSGWFIAAGWDRIRLAEATKPKRKVVKQK